MTADQYVENILGKYAVATGPYSAAERAANAVAPAIRQWAGQWLAELRYSGSYAKGTAISIGTDLDLFISLLSATSGTLAEIYQNLYNAPIFYARFLRPAKWANGSLTAT